jgi:hypothetical protein
MKRNRFELPELSSIDISAARDGMTLGKLVDLDLHGVNGYYGAAITFDTPGKAFVATVSFQKSKLTGSGKEIKAYMLGRMRGAIARLRLANEMLKAMPE